MHKEKAVVGHLRELLPEIGGSLDKFLEFEHEDALHPDKTWRQKLDIALPQQGVGIEQVASQIINDIIPNGSPIVKPGFTSPLACKLNILAGFVEYNSMRRFRWIIPVLTNRS